MTDLPVAGWSPLSTVDWEGRLVSTIFLQGCPLKCVYCHNADLIPYTSQGKHSWEEIYNFMASRRNLLDGLVFSGGEPCSFDLEPHMTSIKDLGFQTGIHTSGMFPRRLHQLIDAEVLNWVGLDFKALPKESQIVTGRTTAFSKFAESLKYVQQVDHEIRTTWHPDIMDVTVMKSMADFLTSAGEKEWVVQKVLSPEWTWNKKADSNIVELQSYCEGKISLHIRN